MRQFLKGQEPIKPAVVMSVIKVNQRTKEKEKIIHYSWLNNISFNKN